MSSLFKTVLVVDDSGDLLELFAVVVRMEGFNAILATNGAEAIDQAVLHHPDLIFMDIQMPLMDGYEATRRILSIPQLSNIPVVAISANYGDDWHRQAREAGCVECLNKPLYPSELHDVIGRYMNH
jgi:CheY-like chemotaxis protein